MYSVINNNGITPKFGFTPFFSVRHRTSRPSAEAGVKPGPFFVELSSNSLVRLSKKRHPEMAFTTKNWAQNGLPNRSQNHEFVDSVLPSCKNPCGLRELAAPEAGFYDEKLALCMAPHGPVFELRCPPISNGSSRSSSTICAYAQIAIPPLQEWKSLCTIHSEAMSAKLKAQCHSYVHLFLSQPKDMYKLGKSCGVK